MHNVTDKAWKCESAENTATFLRLAVFGKENAEFTEFFNENVEKLFVERTNCFLEGLLITDEAIKILIIDKLRNPLFIDKSEIEQVFLN